MTVPIHCFPDMTADRAQPSMSSRRRGLETETARHIPPQSERQTHRVGRNSAGLGVRRRWASTADLLQTCCKALPGPVPSDLGLWVEVTHCVPSGSVFQNLSKEGVVSVFTLRLNIASPRSWRHSPNE